MEITSFFSTEELEIILKLFTALTLGMSLGVERAIVGKTAGMRTYGLVTMGSALFIIIAVLASGGYSTSALFSDSSARITAAIIQGIGFIGAGLIFFKVKDEKVSGVTTAAGIWVASGIGVAIGYGYYLIAVVTTVFTLFVFTALWYIENKVKSFAHYSSEE